MEVACSPADFAGLSLAVLKLGRSLRFRARGSCMQPLLRGGDLLTVEPPGLKALRPGEVVLFTTEKGQLLVHRIVRRISSADGPRYLIQGDRLPMPDGEIPLERIYGRVTALERGGQNISLEGPGMRLLGWLAALHLGGMIARSRSAQFTMQVVKRLPVFYKYLY